MVFSTPTFLFLFLPLVTALYFVTPRVARNLTLLLASLFFYSWGDGSYVFLLLASIGMNYAFALGLERLRGRAAARLLLAFSLVINLGLLAYFKYADFALDNLNALLSALSVKPLPVPNPHLPLGISFYTFHALSYVIDVYRGETRAERDPLQAALYITLFPQLLAGPIIRFHQIAPELHRRRETLEGAAEGVRRLIGGLAKKAILADTLAIYSDRIYALPASELTPSLAWLGSVCFALQLYFDFSGYSDMAIGMGRILGFDFPENFHYPYVARTIGEFWTRWHMSLTGWFRSYLFFPLAQGAGTARNRGNIMLVFFLIGLWHGANWNFVIFGLLHGLVMVAESAGLGAWMRRQPRAVGHLYTLVIILISLVFFRAPSTGQALAYVAAMLGLVGAHGPGLLDPMVNPDSLLLLSLLAGWLACLPLVPWLEGRVQGRPALRLAYSLARLLFLTALLLLSVLRIAAATHQAFIYFRF